MKQKNPFFIVVRMESLIQSLPEELQNKIYEHALELRKPKRVLTTDLKHDIESYRLFDAIVEHYRIVFKDDHMSWVENAVINYLNNHISYLVYITPDLRNVFPSLNLESIIIQLQRRNNPKRLWRYLSPKKRVDLFLSSFELIFNV